MKTELKRKKCQADRAQAISEPKAMRRSVKLTQVDTLLFFPLNWSIVALEGCVSFSFFYTAKQISYTHTHVCTAAQSVMSDSVQPHGEPTRFLCPWDFPGKNTGVGCHLLQGLFPTQGLNLHLLCHIYISLLFFVFPSHLGHQRARNSLCYTVGSHQLSTLYIVVYICQSQSPNSSHHPPSPHLRLRAF